MAVATGTALLAGGLATAGGTAYAANRAKKSSQAAVDSARGISERPMFTGYSSMNRNPVTGGSESGTSARGAIGLVTIDPSIRALREMALGRLPDYRRSLEGSTGEYANRLDETRSAMTSNHNPFIQARVNPLLARAAEGRGELSRGMTRRGLGGSSLFSSSLGNYDAPIEREIADQRAVATAESLNAITGLDTQKYNAAMGAIQAFQSLDRQEQEIAMANLNQELQALGLSAGDTNNLIKGIDQSPEIYGRGLDIFGRLISSYDSRAGQSSWNTGGMSSKPAETGSHP